MASQSESSGGPILEHRAPMAQHHVGRQCDPKRLVCNVPPECYCKAWTDRRDRRFTRSSNTQHLSSGHLCNGCLPETQFPASKTGNTHTTATGMGEYRHPGPGFKDASGGHSQHGCQPTAHPAECTRPRTWHLNTKTLQLPIQQPAGTPQTWSVLSFYGVAANNHTTCQNRMPRKSISI